MAVYQDLINANINNNILTVEYQDNINNIEYLNIKNSNLLLPINIYYYQYFFDTDDTAISVRFTTSYTNMVITSDDKIIVAINVESEISPSTFRTILFAFRMNDKNIYEEILTIICNVPTNIIDNLLSLTIINDNTYPFVLDNMVLDSKENIIFIGELYDNSGNQYPNVNTYYIARVNSNLISYANQSDLILETPISIKNNVTSIQLDSNFGDLNNDLHIGYIQDTYPIINDVTYNIIYNVLIDYLDRILVFFNNPTEDKLMIKRYKNDGTLDYTFNFVQIDVYPTSYFQLLNSKQDELGGFYIISLGAFTGSNIDIIKAFYKIKNDGSLDTSFSIKFLSGEANIYYNNLVVNIKTVTNILGNLNNIENIDEINRLALDNNNKILILGNTILNNNKSAYIARFNSDGTPDINFYVSNTSTQKQFYIIDSNTYNGVNYYYSNIDNFVVDSHNNIYMYNRYETTIISNADPEAESEPAQLKVTLPILQIYNSNGIKNDGSRIYNQVSIDNGETFFYINRNINYGKYGKNIISINLNTLPNLPNITNNYSIQLKTSNEEVTNKLPISDNISIIKYQLQLIFNWMTKITNAIFRSNN
jgi:hypothetical protein